MEPVCINIPMYQGEDFCGVIDLLEMKAIVFDEKSLGEKYEKLDIPEQYKNQAEKQRANLLDALSLFDDIILEKLLAEEKINEEEIRKAIFYGVNNKHLVPCFCGSAFKNKGIQPLLDGVIDFLPSPNDCINSDEDKESDYQFKTELTAPTIAFIFKTQKDKYAGVLSYLRIYQGVLENSKIYYLNNKKKEKISNIYRMHAMKKEAINKAEFGEIVAVTMNQAKTGDTLTTKGVDLLLEKIQPFQPVVSMAIEARSKEDVDRLTANLESIQQEDLSFKVSSDSETGQLLISGMGELHLEVIKDRLIKESKLDIACGKPQVSYRESVSKSAEETVIFSKTLAGSPSFAKCSLKIEENKNLELPIFENKSKVNHPKGVEIVKSIEQAIFKATQSGVLGGYPIIRIKTTLLDFEVKDDDINLQAFTICASQAFRSCLLKCSCFLLAPVMDLRIFSPVEYLGEIMDDLNAKNAKIELIKDDVSGKIIHTFIALTNLFGYTTVLRSLSKGKAYHSAEFAYYEKADLKRGGDNLH